MNQAGFAPTLSWRAAGSAWRSIYLVAVLDDFFDLGAAQGFVLQQIFCDPFEFVAIPPKNRPEQVDKRHPAVSAPPRRSVPQSLRCSCGHQRCPLRRKRAIDTGGA